MASMRCVFPHARHVELTNCIACELHVTLTQQPTNITYMRQHIHTLDLVSQFRLCPWIKIVARGPCPPKNI